MPGDKHNQKSALNPNPFMNNHSIQPGAGPGFIREGRQNDGQGWGKGYLALPGAVYP